MGRDHHDREDRTAHRSICLGNCMSPGRDSVTRAILSKITSNFEQSSFSHGQPGPQTYLQLNIYETYSQDMSGDGLRSHRSPVSSLIHSRNGSGYLSNYWAVQELGVLLSCVPDGNWRPNLLLRLLCDYKLEKLVC